jgi:hypothetical protein
MLGLFGIFGRSQELQRLDQALRGVSLNLGSCQMR